MTLVSLESGSLLVRLSQKLCPGIIFKIHLIYNKHTVSVVTSDKLMMPTVLDVLTAVEKGILWGEIWKGG